MGKRTCRSHQAGHDARLVAAPALKSDWVVQQLSDHTPKHTASHLSLPLLHKPLQQHTPPHPSNPATDLQVLRLLRYYPGNIMPRTTDMRKNTPVEHLLPLQTSL
eukprot:1136301-Pelagomonas_calceolata.AAC.5